ncbi:ATP-grasp domain-containing protein [Chthoniobacter flavus]|nr:ATP-grasp domain-containing protein [Chthoniobacter flavus]
MWVRRETPGKMKFDPDDCCVLNGGDGAWAFASLAEQLSSTLGIPISERAQGFNYVLHLDSIETDFAGESFIPLSAIRTAADKRQTAAAFARHSVPTPRTRLLESFDEVTRFVPANPQSEWCLKYPTGCGANGHRLIGTDSGEPPNWPRPFVVQEFIRLERPEVYRLYGAGGELFGWVARRFPEGTHPSPWVAHARGARYELAGDAPQQAIDVATAALQAAGLLASFGCVDLLKRSSGEWVALEVGTDGIYNHVDRDLNIPSLERDLLDRIADAFRRWVREG